MKYSLALLPPSLLVLSLFQLTACQSKGKDKAAAVAPAQRPASLVEAYIVKAETIDNKITATGSVVAKEELELRSEVNGRVVEIGFQEGRRVAAGTLMVRLDDSELQARMMKLEVDIRNAEQDLVRKQQLLEVKGITAENVAIAEERVASVRAEQALLLAQIAKTQLKAPFAGTVGLRMVSVGSYITPANLIARLSQTDVVKLDFNVPEKYRTLVKIGAAVRFRLEGETRVFEAKVSATEPMIDVATRTLKVRALANNADGVLLPGAFAQIELALTTIPNAIVVPSEAIIPEINGQKVFLAKGGVAKAVPVVTGIRLESRVQVLEGLQVGDTLLTGGLLQLRDGVKLKITRVRE